MKNFEYLPPETEPKQEHQKVFSLARVEDDTKLILETRMQCLTDHHLTFGARCLFTLLFDLALNPFINDSRGIVTASVEKLATLLNAGEASIGEWKKMLVERRYVWIRAHYMPNTWPMHTFSITALVSPDKRLLGKPTGDGLWGNGQRRSKLLSEGAMDQKLIRTKKGPKQPNTSKIEEISTAGSENHGLSGSETDPGRIRNRSGQDQKLIRPGSETDPGRIRKHSLPGSENRGCPDQKTGVIRESLEGVKGSGEHSLSCLTAEKGSKGTKAEQCSGSTALKVDLDREREFLQRLGEITGPKEMANWGGRWRNRYRENPGKAIRVLAELKSMHKEGSIVRNAGAAADDLWRRFV